MSSGSILPFTGLLLRLEELRKVSRELGTLLTAPTLSCIMELDKLFNRDSCKETTCTVTLTLKGALKCTPSFIQQFFINTCSGPGIPVLGTTGLVMTITGMLPALGSLQGREQTAGKWKYTW